MVRRYIVDPLFRSRLRELRIQCGMSYRDLGRKSNYTHAQIWAVETGKRRVTPEFAGRVDLALGAGGELKAMVHVWDGLDGDDEQRLMVIVNNPRRMDNGTLDTITGLLASVRRLEDEVGSVAVLSPVVARLHVIEALATEARGPIRPRVLSIAAQWAQFGGWLNANTNEFPMARRWYGCALEWAIEIGDTQMLATALSMRGHVAWIAGNLDAAASLAEAAWHQPATPGVRALAAQMRARASAEMGERTETRHHLDDAVALLDRAMIRPEDEPPWQYFYSHNHLLLQGGLAYNRLGLYRQAVEALSGGLAGLPPEIRRIEWMVYYVYELALAHTGMGEYEAARAALDEAENTVTTKGSPRLAALTRAVRGRIDRP